MNLKDEFPRPSFRDWLLLLVSLGFAAAGGLLFREDLNAAISFIVFFGIGAFVSAGTILRKRRFRQESRVNEAEIAGGVPIRPSRKAALMTGLAMFVSGAVLLYFGDPFPLLYTLSMFALTSMGAFILLGVIFRFLPKGYIQFDPPGLSVGERLWTLTIPWDQIIFVAPGGLGDNVMLLIGISQIEAVEVRPEKYREKVLKRFKSNIRWFGVPMTIMPGRYGLSLPLLIKAMERYITVPASRETLKERPALGTDKR
jgi:hypothetical protein